MTSKTKNLKISLLFIFVILINFVTSVVSEHPKILAEPEYVVDAGANYTIICEGNQPLFWDSSTTLLRYNSQQQPQWNNFHIDEAKPQNQSYKYALQLCIQNVTYLLTGFYYCHHVYGYRSNENDKHYLYIKDPEHLAVYEPNCDDYGSCEALMRSYTSRTIPCRPTSPDVNVKFQDVSFVEAKTTYPYDPTIGFHFTAKTLGDTDYTYNYDCIFTRGNKKYKQSWKISALSNHPYHDELLIIPKVKLENLKIGYKVIEDDLLLKCSIETNVKVKMSWTTPLGLILKNDNRARIKDRNLYGDVKSEVLWIKNATKDDRGNYSCIVDDFQSHTENASIMVWIYDVGNGLDLFGLHDTNTFDFGGTIELTCAASKFLYNESLSLLHSTNAFDDDDARISIRRNQTAYSNRVSVAIRNITFADGGVYSCAANHYGWKIPVYKNITLFVKAVPPVINSTNMNGNIKMELTNTIELYCTFNGIPEPTITWFKDNLELIETPNHIQFMDEKQKLLLIRTELSDEGLYRCVGSNIIGRVATQVYLEFTNKPEKKSAWLIVTIITITILSVPTLLAIIIVSCKVKSRSRKLKRQVRLENFANFERGGLENLNPDLCVDEQAELLPYDKKFEFPIEKLKLGKQVGSGAFGVVMKGEAKGLNKNETVTTVAVKMCKKNADPIYIKALTSELKIMVHLGKHLNVVNLIGACTKNIVKKELLVIVEYCRFGNLQNYLLRHRNFFIDQVDQKTRKINYSIIQETLERQGSVFNNQTALADNSNCETMARGIEDYERQKKYLGTTADTDVTTVTDDEGVASLEPEWRSNYFAGYRGDVKPICTTDLLVWAFQVARGMEYLVSRKVLHGDLAARNILLADDNVVKICDFGLAKSMYRSEIYKRKNNKLLPMKWMAIESIKDYIFSTQSDVWSFGIVLWEFFSLGSTPYPGMPADDRLYNKLINDYRMESPDYAPQNIYNIMLNCWDSRPGSRPTFSTLSERLGSILADTFRQHYIDLNSPYLVMNSKRLEDGQSDYLAMMTAPDFQILSSPHLQEKNSSVAKSNENELWPMLKNRD